uniref:F-actin-capping protein subunit alpha n=1 Tax=Globodera rostochiensis TaxID=31243 RepID=A0A914GZ06_GLORO
MSSEELTDAEKARIASDFLLQSPPGEFNEVFSDVRTLLQDDALLEKGTCLEAVRHYNKAQFATVKSDPGVEHPTLITEHNELADGRFVDPKSGRVFKYDHLHKEAMDSHPAGPKDMDEKLEPWRKALQKELDEYIYEHFHLTGVATVFTPLHQHKEPKLVVLCIESHQYQPKNYWNGRWRSEWHLPNFDGKTAVQKCTGKLRLQVHYYEDGNVQLISEKEAVVEVKMANDREASAREVLRAICEAESAYQRSIQESQEHMESTFKALRRQLPVTRSKLNWLNFHSFRITQQEMKPPSAGQQQQSQ